MTIAVPVGRPPVVSEVTYSHLDELMRFRHFKRYYFNVEYDWHRLDYLLSVARATEPLLRVDLASFSRFLVEVRESITESTPE